MCVNAARHLPTARRSAGCVRTPTSLDGDDGDVGDVGDVATSRRRRRGAVEIHQWCRPLALGPRDDGGRFTERSPPSSASASAGAAGGDVVQNAQAVVVVAGGAAWRETGSAGSNVVHNRVSNACASPMSLARQATVATGVVLHRLPGEGDPGISESSRSQGTRGHAPAGAPLRAFGVSPRRRRERDVRAPRAGAAVTRAKQIRRRDVTAGTQT
jgi:hypothetical protein